MPFTPAAPMQAFPVPRVTGYPPQYNATPQAPGYKAPQPVECFVLNDHANLSIPQDIREQFQLDEKGRVLFFTAPPLNVEPPLTKDGRALGHSARYLAAKAKKEAAKALKRKADEAGASERDEAAKRAKVEEEQKFKQAVQDLNTKALKALEDQLAAATKSELETSFNGRTKEGVQVVLDGLVLEQGLAERKRLERAYNEIEREERKRMAVTGMTGILEEKI